MKRVLLSCMAIAAGATIAMAQEEPVFPSTLEYTLNGQKELAGVKVDIKDGSYGPSMSITGESDAEEITITFAVPDGWDGWIISPFFAVVSDQPYETRAEKDWSPIEDFLNGGMGYQKGNSVTFVVDGEDASATLALYKGNMAYNITLPIEYNVAPAGGSSVVDGPAFPKNIGVTTYAEGLEVEQYIDWGTLTIELTGEISEETFDVVLDVPEGWDGFISLPYADNIEIGESGIKPRKTRADASAWQPIKEFIEYAESNKWDPITPIMGNKFTFKPNGSRQDVAVYLYKDDMVYLGDGNDWISLENNEVTTTYDPFPKTFEASLSGQGLSLTQGMDEYFGVYTINVEGKCPEKEVTLTLNVPEGWDGFVYMSDVDSGSDVEPLSTRSQEPEWVPLDMMLEFGLKEGNSITVPVDGDEHYGQFYLYKDGLVDGANQIVTIFNVEYDYEKANQAAYDALMVKVDALQEEYDAALTALKKKYPDYDFSEWEYIIGENLKQTKAGALQALNAANEDGVDFNFPFDGEEIEAMIAEMNVKVPLTVDNQAAYDKVIAQLDAAQAEYEAALEALKAECPYYDFSEWNEIIGGMLDQTRTGAKQALEAANEDGEEFFYPFDDEEFEAMLAEMKKDAENAPAFPEKLDVTLSDEEGVKVSQGVEQGVYTISVSGQSEQKELTVTVAVPEGWDGFIGMSDVDANDQAAPAKVAPVEWVSVEEMEAYGMKKGNTMTFPVDGAEHSGQYYLYKGNVLDLANQIAIEFNVESPLTAANKAAYDEVIAKIDGLQKEYDEALAALTEKYPDYDFSEWKEIIGNALEEAKTGANQALKAANEDGAEYAFAFNGEEIEAMIAEMNAKVPVYVGNQAAYDAVIAKIDELQKEYEEALAAVTAKYPDTDFSEWEEIITKALDEAKSGAAQALASANEDGVEFNFAFDGEDIKGMIAEMYASAALTEANQAAYDAVIAKIDELQKEYDEAVAEIKENNPDFDFTEWDEMIAKALEETTTGAEQALKAANEDGEEFNFAFDGEDIENIIEEMKKSATGSGVSGVAIDENASYYDLNGHKINRPQAGMYIKVVDGKSSKVVIK